MLKAHELGTFSDVLFYMERHGIAKEDAASIAIRVFQWGVSAAMERIRIPSPAPADAPVADCQLSLIAIAQADAAKRGKPATPKQIARVWPEDFVLADAHIKFATDRGLTTIEAQRQWERFRDRNKARGEKYVDWNAAWRTWVNNQIEFKNRDNRQQIDRGKPDDRL